MQYFVFGFHFGKLHCTGTGLKSISICLGAVLIHLFYQIGQLFGAPKHYLWLHQFGSFNQNLNMYIEFKINSEKTLTCKNKNLLSWLFSFLFWNVSIQAIYFTIFDCKLYENASH